MFLRAFFRHGSMCRQRHVYGTGAHNGRTIGVLELVNILTERAQGEQAVVGHRGDSRRLDMCAFKLSSSVLLTAE